MTTKATDPCQEIASFLKERSILKVLDEQVLWGVSLLMEELTFSAGDLIFEEGAASDSLYIVRSGTVEVQKGKRKPKPLAYLTAGECFGEIGVVQGTARGASVRVPEKATVLKLSKHALDELRRKFPKISVELADLINKRTEVDFQPEGMSGSLAVFDLATVIQTIASSKQSGLLSLCRHGSIMVAALQFEQGKLKSARFENLRSELAFYELLAKREPLNFVFEPGVSSADGETDSTIDKPIDMLLIEGMRRSDEIVRIDGKLAKLGTVIVRTVEEIEAIEVPGVPQEIFPRLWKLLAEPIEIKRLQGLCAADRYSIQKLLEVLHAQGVIKESELLKTDQPDAASLVTTQMVLTEDEVKMLKEARKASMTSEISLEAFSESNFETGAFPASSSPVADTIVALNSAASALSIIVDTRTARSCLSVALDQAKEQFPQLAPLKLHEENAMIDMLDATQMLLDAENLKAAKTLAYLFFGLVVYSDWFSTAE